MIFGWTFGLRVPNTTSVLVRFPTRPGLLDYTDGDIPQGISRSPRRYGDELEAVQALCCLPRAVYKDSGCVEPLRCSHVTFCRPRLDSLQHRYRRVNPRTTVPILMVNTSKSSMAEMRGIVTGRRPRACLNYSKHRKRNRAEERTPENPSRSIKQSGEKWRIC